MQFVNHSWREKDLKPQKLVQKPKFAFYDNAGNRSQSSRIIKKDFPVEIKQNLKFETTQKIVKKQEGQKVLKKDQLRNRLQELKRNELELIAKINSLRGSECTPFYSRLRILKKEEESIKRILGMKMSEMQTLQDSSNKFTSSK